MTAGRQGAVFCMKDYLNEIDSRFPVRNSEAQKEAFRDYVLEETGKYGYFASVEMQGCMKPSAQRRNIVIGSPENARAVFTAHYDTPRRAFFPNMLFPLNPVMKILCTLLPMIPMLAVSIGAAFGLRSLLSLEGFPGRLLTVAVYAVVYCGLFFLLMHGPANKHNRNDNTSGTAAILSLAEKLSGVPGVAFILFDDEEKGRKGSKAYAQYRPEVKENRLVINMDCVGNGDTFIAGATEAAMNDPLFPALAAALEGIGAKVSEKARMNSDQKSFNKGVGICACTYQRGIGYSTGRIHTVRDTAASPENIEKLTDALAVFARGI